MRDAWSLLDQCLAFHFGQKLTYDKVLDVLGAVDTEVFSRLLRCVAARNVPGCIGVLEEIVLQGRDMGQFVGRFYLVFKKSAPCQNVRADGRKK